MMTEDEKMSNTAQAACFCTGKRSGCTCDGSCACACTCWKDKIETTFELDWMTEIKNPDLVPEGQKELHKTRGGKGAVSQAIARDKLRKLPPNCS